MPRRRKSGCLVGGLLLLFAGVGLVVGPTRPARELGNPKLSPEQRNPRKTPPVAAGPLNPAGSSAVRSNENSRNSKNSKQLQLEVIGVHDGDTLTGLDDTKTQHKVRLDAIDAPELGQPFGQAAKKGLAEKVFGKNVVVTVKTRDRYGRTVGHVLIDGRDVNLEMLEEGMAWHYKKYDTNVRLSRAEENARAARKGLWQDRNPVPPWDWRRGER